MSTITTQMNLMTTGQAAKHFDVSQKTIQRWIAAGKLKADLIDGRWFIHLDVPDDGQAIPDDDTDKPDDGHLRELLVRADSEMTHLRNQLDRRDQQIEEKDHQLQELHTIIAMQQKSLDKLTEQNQLLLEDTRRKPSLWHRLKSRFTQF